MKLLLDHHLSYKLAARLLRGAPPKIVWLRMGNCTTGAVERVLRANAEAIANLVADSERTVLELFNEE